MIKGNSYLSVSTLKEATDEVAVEKILQWLEMQGNPHFCAFDRNLRNGSVINMAGDPGSAVLGERITNMEDAVIERMAQETGLAQSNPTREKILSAANKTYQNTVKIENVAKDRPTLIFRDKGTGLTSSQMVKSILKFQGGQKHVKNYLHGRFGQGGATSLRHSKYTLIMSKAEEGGPVAFTIIRRCPKKYGKVRHYEYLVDGRNKMAYIPDLEKYQEKIEEYNCIPYTIEDTKDVFQVGTRITHIGVDGLPRDSKESLYNFASYLNSYLWEIEPLEVVHKKGLTGSRRKTEGGIDQVRNPRRLLGGKEGIESQTLSDGSTFKVSWFTFSNANTKVLRELTKGGRTVVLATGGQKHADLSKTLLSVHAKRSWAADNTLVYVDLSDVEVDKIFTSSRESAVKNDFFREVKQEIVRILEEDQALERIDEILKTQHQGSQSSQQKQKAIAAKIQDRVQSSISSTSGFKAGKRSTKRGGGGRQMPKPIGVKQNPEKFEPKTGSNHKVYPGQKKQIGFETDIDPVLFEDGDYSMDAPSFIESYRWSTNDHGHKKLFLNVVNDDSFIGNTENLRIRFPNLPKIKDVDLTLTVEEKPESKFPKCPDIETILASKKTHPHYYGDGCSFEDDYMALDIKPSKDSITLVFNTDNTRFSELLDLVKEKKSKTAAESLMNNWELDLAVASLVRYFTFLEEDPEEAVNQDHSASANEGVCASLSREFKV